MAAGRSSNLTHQRSVGDAANDSPAVAGAKEVVLAATRASEAHGRQDLAQRMAATLQRLERPDAVVCIAGEFKKGKSTLVNALLGENVCPVDDDLATCAVTMVRHRSEPRVMVHRRDKDRLVAEEVPPSEIASYVTERGNPGNRRRVELVEVGLPNRVLSSGITLVDTPGVGGLSRIATRSTLAALPMADALIFVSDASAELSAPELDFLCEAAAVCPTVLTVVTKADLYPEWKRVSRLTAQHLEAAEVATVVLSASGRLRVEAVSQGNRELNRRSGVPELLRLINERVLARKSEAATSRALSESIATADQLRAVVAAELAAVREPGRAEEAVEQIRVARTSLAELSDARARWRQIVADGFSSLSASVEHDLRSQLRDILRRLEEQIGKTDPSATWPELSAQLQEEIAEAVRAAFGRVYEGGDDVGRQVRALLSSRTADLLVHRDDDAAPDAREFWLGRSPDSPSMSAQAGQAFTAMRGAFGGIFMLGMLASIAGIAMIGPAALAVGTVFGGVQLRAQRSRMLEQRRQESVRFAKQFADDVQFEVLARLREVARDVHRQLRDDIAERLEELGRTAEGTVRSLERASKYGREERAKRAQQLEAEIRRLDQIRGRAREIEASR